MLVSLLVLAVAPQDYPSYNPDFPKPAGYDGPVFQLLDGYPTDLPPPEDGPWSNEDFETDPHAYLLEVLDYILEGNIDAGGGWAPEDNTVRGWYHAPWMTVGCGGREFTHGLTRERSSRPEELHPDQDDWIENWAVGFYNPPGGYTLGRVWKTGGEPDPSAANFPVGTVGGKLLFTAADPATVPYLASSYEITADIYDTQGNPCPRPPPDPPNPRVLRTMWLLQFDVAVRHESGWVFGTFIYNAAAPGATPWERMVPVCAIWDDDVTVKSRMHDEGAFVNPDLKGTWVNADLIRDDSFAPNRAFVTHFGLGGRANGPVDNWVSSCFSCHGRSSLPFISTASSASSPANFPDSEFETYFAPIAGGVGPNGQGGRYLDYSLQLAVGLGRYCQANPTAQVCNQGIMLEAAEARAAPPHQVPTRGGASDDEEEYSASPGAATRTTGEEEGSRTLWIVGGVVLVLLIGFFLMRRG